MGPYHDMVYGLMHLLGATNSIANPILYGYMNENFRNEYRKFYKKMPWYNTSLVLVRSIRRNVIQKPEESELCQNQPLMTAVLRAQQNALVPSDDSHGFSHQSNGFLHHHKSNDISLPPKRLRKLKSNDILMTNHYSNSAVVLENSKHGSLMNNVLTNQVVSFEKRKQKYATIRRTTSFVIHSQNCPKQRAWIKRSGSSFLDRNMDIDVKSRLESSCFNRPEHSNFRINPKILHSIQESSSFPCKESQVQFAATDLFKRGDEMEYVRNIVFHQQFNGTRDAESRV